MDNTKIIKDLRKSVGLTQSELAQKLNVSFQAVGKWERGESYPSAALLPELAKALNCTIDDLYNGGKETDG